MAVSEAKYEEMKELYRAEVCKRQALEKENDRLVQLNNALVDRVNELATAGENVGKLAAELQRVTEERDSYQGRLRTAARANDSLMEEVKQLKAQATEAHDQFEKRVKELADGLDASAALLKTAQDERDVARQEADALRKRCQRAEERAVQLQEQINVHEEVVERIREQNCRFVEEQREAKKRADTTAASLIKAKEDVSRLVGVLDGFKEQLKATREEAAAKTLVYSAKHAELQADYDARGRVIKKLRKRLHKLKKKLKH